MPKGTPMNDVDPKIWAKMTPAEKVAYSKKLHANRAMERHKAQTPPKPPMPVQHDTVPRGISKPINDIEPELWAAMTPQEKVMFSKMLASERSKAINANTTPEQRRAYRRNYNDRVTAARRTAKAAEEANAPTTEVRSLGSVANIKRVRREAPLEFPTNHVETDDFDEPEFDEAIGGYAL